jgi:hypothetical protein
VPPPQTALTCQLMETPPGAYGDADADYAAIIARLSAVQALAMKRSIYQSALAVFGAGSVGRVRRGMKRAPLVLCTPEQRGMAERVVASSW